MKGPILYCGDPHGEFRHIIEAAGHTKASAVVLLGDLEPERPLHEELAPILDRVWWIPGNHDADSDDLWVRVWGSKLADRNVHGRVVTLPDGTRLAGLGGVFREAVWYPTLAAARGGAPAFRTREEHAAATPRQDRWLEGHHRKHWGTIYPDELDRLAELQADVLVTHEAPAYHPNGFDILDTLAQSMGVRVHVHGHQHDRLDSSARWPSQAFASIGVGLRGISAVRLEADGVHVRVHVEVVRKGELDDERAGRLAAALDSPDAPEAPCFLDELPPDALMPDEATIRRWNAEARWRDERRRTLPK
jgi:predicted phosphodiesterase